MSNSHNKIYIESDGYAPTLKRLQQISKLLDNAITIPGTPVGIGLDPILGLIPVGGDVLGLIFSLYIIIESAKLGISKATLGRMIVNIIIDALVGAIPMLGDLFDFAWRANNYNLILLEDYLKSPGEKKKADQGFIIALFAVLVVLCIVLVALPVIFIGMLWKALNGG
ncbi:DUF4112 domain-containing protein [Anabaena aphanizomenioides LEGE 00250]|jgi:hypothetical protein|uniref:DUF4112 domain-containing protein n=1 Tax=Sphaerospermopsis aphanizomenoides LEGE 00250 TaxID=2777972 RepID=A0ABR9VFP8_9CYAN|nr:DUF4112 domain-containing protein [Sphaerospermopsis aphanizomenoides]MBE9237309.1 DUF4112 domain-containing protein [Sphaerospermopsis aphanizomenoides LEGE 00250]